MIVTPDGWLVSDGGATVVRLPTVRTTPLAQGGPRALVWHATGGVGGPRFAEGLARRIQSYRRGIDRAASWAILLPRAGRTLYQSAPLTVGTWHVGRPGVIEGVTYPHINKVSIGVELENAGPLARIGGAYFAHPYWLDAKKRVPDPRCRVPVERVVTYSGRAHDAFTQDQVTIARELVSVLAAHFSWGAAQFLLSHGDFASPAKTDPGPLWMKRHLPRLLSDIFTGDGPTIVTEPPEPESSAARRVS
ncbi:MAG: N-acetylmuramoyl-L-alanine amidase [Kofleriaceae bacterium]|nr:N-acetylmuramoyl-L-alanine amidase [Kofleriaceae bacterium]